MQFLNTCGKMNFEDRLEYDTTIFTIHANCLDLPIKEFQETLRATIQAQVSSKPMLYIIQYSGTMEELYYIIDTILEDCIATITSNGAPKFKEEIWQPRESISDYLAINLYNQRRLINFTCINELFNIQMQVNGETVYNLITKEIE